MTRILRPVVSPIRRMTRPLDRGHTLLYRFYGDYGELLYVGITDCPVARWTAHACRAAWWRRASMVTVERYRSRKDAAGAERAAIKAELPLFNIAGAA